MDPAWPVVAALAFGFLVGILASAGFVAARRRGRIATQIADPRLPDGVAAVIDVLESAGIVLDASNNVLEASSAAIELGLVRDRRLVHPEIATLVDEVRRAAGPVSRDLHLSRGPIGDPVIRLHVRVAPLPPRFVLVIAEDRTEAYRVEEARRDFVANVSHELKTPIGAVGLLAEALGAAADDPDDVRRFADRLTAEADRLARLCEDLIELSRLQATDAVTGAAPVEVDSIIQQAVDRNRVAAEQRGIELVVGDATGVLVLGDDDLLVTAVHNLIANAIQYSPDGSRVGIGVHAVGGGVEISVTDQGIGIPEDELDRVFERFFRVDDARSRHTGGSGLGLSIVKHVVQNHGGEVRAWSRPGKGSTFTIRLPEAAPVAADGRAP